MKLKFDDGKSVNLQFEKNSDGGVSVFAKDQRCGYLITFDTDGTMTRHCAVGPDIGFKRDKTRVKIKKGY